MPSEPIRRATQRLRDAGYLLPPVLDMAAVARALGTSPAEVLQMHARGEIPLARIGSTFRITRHCFQQWLDGATAFAEPGDRSPPDSNDEGRSDG